MAQSVSNDALWVKLSEMDKKLDRYSTEQKSLVLKEEPVEIKPDFRKIKDEIIIGIKDEILILSSSNDSNFEGNKKNVQILSGNIVSTLKQVDDIRKQLTAYIESSKVNRESHFNFWLFKVRKTFFVITILGLLVFILTLFCMMQQNDYSLLMDEYWKQDIAIQKLDGELKALEEKQLKKPQRK